MKQGVSAEPRCRSGVGVSDVTFRLAGQGDDFELRVSTPKPVPSGVESRHPARLAGQDVCAQARERRLIARGEVLCVGLDRRMSKV